MNRRRWITLAAIAALTCACSDGPWVTAVERSNATTTTSTNAPPVVDGNGVLGARELVEALAADELAGRDNLTPGSVAAQEIIIGQISQFAQPVFPEASGTRGYLQSFAQGTNILGVIPGSDLADEFVVIGAHYDHLGFCDTSDPADHVCNGATDNATGVSVAISAARAIAAEGKNRRSILLALWDAEEDGLLGSTAYVAEPIVPLDQTVVYINFDIQGATVLPSLADVTISVGAETGGIALAQAAATASAASTLEPLPLSSFLFSGRSDHASFIDALVPAMLLTDAVGGCYHTAQDEADIVDFAKLDQQVLIGIKLITELASTDAAPQFDLGADLIVFGDVVAALEIIDRSEPDWSLLTPTAAAQVEHIAAELHAIADAGADAFGEDAKSAAQTGIEAFIEALTESSCQSFAP